MRKRDSTFASMGCKDIAGHGWFFMRRPRPMDGARKRQSCWAWETVRSGACKQAATFEWMLGRCAHCSKATEEKGCGHSVWWATRERSIPERLTICERSQRYAARRNCGFTWMERLGRWRGFQTNCEGWWRGSKKRIGWGLR